MVHRAAAEGFAAGADTYAKARPGYPPEVAHWLRDDLALDAARTVLDLGSGTGKFLPYLQATGAKIIAVEPVSEMRAQLISRYPDVEAKEGTAERIPLADESVDAVSCAQSFHWFATRAALNEMHRVLKPGGVLGLIWNVRDESVDWVAALTRIWEAYEGDAPRYRSLPWQALFPAPGFAPLRERHFPHAHIGPLEQVIIDRSRSISFIAALPEVDQQRVISQVRQLIATSPALANRSEVAFPYKTAAYSCVKVS